MRPIKVFQPRSNSLNVGGDQEGRGIGTRLVNRGPEHVLSASLLVIFNALRLPSETK